MEAIELSGVGSVEWDAVLAGEQNVWGPGEELAWTQKTRHVGVIGEDGRPLAMAGAVLARVAVGEGEPFPVVGIGGVIVTRSMRGRGFARLVVEGILRLAAGLGPDLTMLFCGEQLTPMYARFGFSEIEGTVSADQPSGAITMPMRSMWAPLAPGASWPAGDVQVLGEPF